MENLIHAWCEYGLIEALQSLYRGSSACVRKNGAYIDWFDIGRSVRQGCIASSWLFNLFMDSYLYDLKEYECRLRMDELSVKYLVYTDDQVMLAVSACGLQEMVNKINDSVKKKGVKVNVGSCTDLVGDTGRFPSAVLSAGADGRGGRTPGARVLRRAPSLFRDVVSFAYYISTIARDLIKRGVRAAFRPPPPRAPPAYREAGAGEGTSAARSRRCYTGLMLNRIFIDSTLAAGRGYDRSDVDCNNYR
ncbi:Retrovirus-related Pol polyprotein from type-2 retrotransposable element R2DM; Endonuclease [Eumeta japonica]|uniref:Retrovirus-related Pol polyprotein from type-2 retrotransposable element R2DM Endonuclease n=1 Tax=Eumeta variegata TaxID=151549 RepID=A0A4C1Y330_EUMVA|nr:Retrovirus-related Pol polyprotein from type-2 retrotransposable element R2DM; Endonuclease [Eumeta japonica]